MVCPSPLESRKTGSASACCLKRAASIGGPSCEYSCSPGLFTGVHIFLELMFGPHRPATPLGPLESELKLANRPRNVCRIAERCALVGNSLVLSCLPCFVHGRGALSLFIHHEAARLKFDDSELCRNTHWGKVTLVHRSVLKGKSPQHIGNQAGVSLLFARPVILA